MKIAMISLYLPSESKQGVGYQAHYMADALVRHGHSVTMFSPCLATEGALYETVTINVGRRLRTFRFAWVLRKANFEGYDVIHAHGDDYLIWEGGIPHVRTMHGSCLAEAWHIPGLFEKARMLMLGVSEILATIVADRTICVSRNTLRFYPWLKEVIFNGVDLEAFKVGATKEDRPTILFVGTYLNRKRGRMLMESFRDVILPAIPNAQLWMVSDDAPSEPGVKVFGRVPFGQLVELYQRAWIFCLPSTYEGFGVPYIEAMASGTPVVATPNVGACEVLGNGVHGILATDEELGSCLVRLLNDSRERDELRERGLRRAQDFAWDQIVKQYEGIYTSIPSTGRVRRGVQVAT